MFSNSKSGQLRGEPQPSRTLFLGDLSLYCTEKEIFQVFASFGPIVSIHLKRVPQGLATHLSYGFVRFQHRYSAEAAMISMQGALLFGRPLRVGWAEETRNIKQVPYQTKPPMSAAPSHLYRPPHAQIHVIFTSDSLTPVTELRLRQIFERFGEVLDVSLKRLLINKENGQQSGYGFIHYPFNDRGISSAIKAAHDLNERVVDFIHFQCNMSHGLARFLNEKREQTKPNLQERSDPFSTYCPNNKRQSADCNQVLDWNSSYDLPPSYRSSSNSSTNLEWLAGRPNEDLYEASTRFPLPSSSSSSYFDGNFSSPSFTATADVPSFQTFEGNCYDSAKREIPLSYDYGIAQSDSPSTVSSSITAFSVDDFPLDTMN